ncbi:MAG: glycerol-3-phosphate acyltransferase [Bacillota bacterium]
MELLVVAMCYAAGSVVFGVVMGRVFFGDDLRRRDNPGGSGSWRQYGPVVGMSVAALDVAKGAAAVALARGWGLSGWYLVAAAAAVVGGHNWPVWFGFRGGGGLGTLVGTLLVLAPAQIGVGLAVALAAAALYRVSPLYRVCKVAALPGGAVVGIPFFLYLAWSQGNATGAQAALASGLLIGVRGLQMLKTRPG